MFKRYKTQDVIVRSRRFFILEGITGNAHMALTTGAFLAGFVNLLGGTEQINGLIAIIPAVTGVFQIASPLIFERLKNRKKTLLKFIILLRVLLSSVFFLPILLRPLNLGLPIFIAIFALAYISNALVASVIGSWLIDLTPIEIRGRYLARRDGISLFVVALLTLVLGKVLDFTKLSGHDYTGFTVVGIVLVIMSVFNIYSVMNIVEVEGKSRGIPYKLKEILTVPLKDKSFRRIIILFVLWSIALQIGGPYISIYMVTRLKLSYTYMMGVFVLGTITRVLCTSLWGKLADSKSWFLTTKLSLLLLAGVHFSWGFVSGSNANILVPLLNILSGLSWGGIGISLFNIQFLFAKREGRIMYLGLNAAISGLFSLSVWVGGKLIALFEGVKIHFLFFTFNNMQIVFVISGLLLALCPLYIKYFIERSNPILEIE